MTMIEVERKRALADGGNAVTARLIELGYRDAGSFVEVDTYYGPRHRDFLSTRECLRVRRSGQLAEITYKPASDATTHSAADVIAKPEVDVVLADSDEAEAANELMTCVGMVMLARVEKARTLYQRGGSPGVMVAVDVVDELGAFVEVEIMTSDADGAAMVLEEVESSLGILASPVVAAPYRDLIRECSGTADGAGRSVDDQEGKTDG